jgi:hypothetical protein
MIRGLLVTICFLVILLYLLIFIFLDPIFLLAGDFEPGPLLESTIRFFLLASIAFCVGILGQVFTSKTYNRTYWDIITFIKISVIPVLVLAAISINPVMGFILRLPVIRDNSAEFYYYIISTRYLWIIWIGFGLGSSIRFPSEYLPRRAYKPTKTEDSSIE